MIYTVKITFYPKYINNFSSFHLLSEDEYNELKLILNDESLFIENFFRTTKNCYEHLSSENIELNLINDIEQIEFIAKYIDMFGNDFDLYDMITTNFIEEDNSSIDSISDEDMQDTNNILKIFNFDLKNKPDEIENIISENPHLLEDENLSEWYE